jgi:hypothetical protein
MMIEINYMATAAGSFYFLGSLPVLLALSSQYLMLTDTTMRYDGFKIMLVSIIWPYNVLEIIWNAILNRGDDA